MALVTFTSDFGLKDSYVAEVKAVLLSQVPSLTIVDVSHEVPAHNIEAGAFQVFRSYRWFPPSAFHLVVVDPGVGTERKCLFVRTSHGTFIGPDNGVLLWAIEDAEKNGKKKAQVFEIPVRQAVRPTFYGRDVFAPFLASHLKGRKARLEKMSEIVGESFPEPDLVENHWVAKALYIDHFGNIVTNLPIESARYLELKWKKKKILQSPNYLSIPTGECALVAGSHGFWEIAARETSAQKLLKLSVGDVLHLIPTKIPKN